MKGVFDFLKYRYITHLSEMSTDPHHDVKFVFKHGRFPTRTIVSTYIDCNTPFKFLKEVRRAMVECTEQIEYF